MCIYIKEGSFLEGFFLSDGDDCERKKRQKTKMWIESVFLMFFFFENPRGRPKDYIYTLTFHEKQQLKIGKWAKTKHPWYFFFAAFWGGEGRGGELFWP